MCATARVIFMSQTSRRDPKALRADGDLGKKSGCQPGGDRFRAGDLQFANFERPAETYTGRDCFPLSRSIERVDVDPGRAPAIRAGEKFSQPMPSNNERFEPSARFLICR